MGKLGRGDKKMYAELQIECFVAKLQFECFVYQAENELVLVRSILEWRSWEPLVEAAPKNQWKWPM